MTNMLQRCFVISIAVLCLFALTSQGSQVESLTQASETSLKSASESLDHLADALSSSLESEDDDLDDVDEPLKASFENYKKAESERDEKEEKRRNLRRNKNEKKKEEKEKEEKEKKKKKGLKYVAGLAEPVEEVDDGSRDILRPGPNDPIDIVYTWVNGSDDKWLKLHNAYLTKVKDDIDEGTRLFSDNGELRYSLRSIAHYANALNFRHIFVVTEQQVPTWLNISNPRIKVVTHADMMDPEDVPSFSTFAIEANLDRIPGLSEHFLYFNDDFFVGQPINKDTLFDKDGKQKVFMSRKWVHTRPCSHTHPWRCALRYTSSLFDKKYGFRKRFIAAHAPLLMSRTVMRRMRRDFKVEFKKTSSHRFRGLGDNISLYFMYAEYLLAEKYPARQIVGTCRDTYQYVDLFEDGKGKLRDLKDPNTQAQIWDALTDVGDSQFFVINKADGHNQLIRRFMSLRFPIPSEFEDPDVPNYN
eukprot:GILI01002390.1.p1 GENE.GILI01002390.1~~GILI01002390.1.p1  ORF type:complete len:473 (+),score=167.25 GILI01002390.1:140-1558(+)